MGSALVDRGARLLFTKGHGSANLEWDIPNTPNIKFRLGSVTKQFTAASILLLEERGKLSVSDPVKKFMPRYSRGLGQSRHFSSVDPHVWPCGFHSIFGLF
jgi:CubicO group peptidase (beta-lactamase class C family)